MKSYYIDIDRYRRIRRTPLTLLEDDDAKAFCEVQTAEFHEKMKLTDDEKELMVGTMMKAIAWAGGTDMRVAQRNEERRLEEEKQKRIDEFRRKQELFGDLRNFKRNSQAIMATMTEEEKQKFLQEFRDYRYGKRFRK